MCKLRNVRGRSDLFKVTAALPIRHGTFKRLNLQPRGVNIEIHHALTKGFARKFAAVEPIRRCSSHSVTTLV